MRTVARLAPALLLLVLPGVARADLCEDAVGDPVPLAMRDGGFDAGRSACLRSDLDVRLTSYALIDTPDFYGTLGGELQLGIAFVEPIGFEWGVTVRALDVTFAQTAVLSTTEATYGPFAVHAAVSRAQALAGRELRLGALVRAELPFTRATLDTSYAGAQLAGLASWQLARSLTLHTRLGLLGWYASSSSGSDTRGAVALSSDAAVRVLPWLSLLGGVEAQAGWYGGVDHLAARAGAHWRVRGPWRLDAGVALPVLGDERTDLVFTLGVRRDR